MMGGVIRGGRMNVLTATGIPGGRAQACHVGPYDGMGVDIASPLRPYGGPTRPSLGSRGTKRPANFDEALVRASTSAPWSRRYPSRLRQDGVLNGAVLPA
ncbi:hypothetical protein BC2230_11067 [Burkholderia cepacia]